MTVLILGFDSVAEIDKYMMEMIERSGVYLFNVLCGEQDSAAKEWAEMRGAPQFYINAKAPWQLEKNADFILLKATDRTPQWMKNLAMTFKNNGKHGRIIR